MPSVHNNSTYKYFFLLHLPAWSTSPWTPCTAPCGNGTQTLTRTCRNATHTLQPEKCGRAETLVQRFCNPKPCAGYLLGNWTDWSSCSLSCGGGMMEKHRNCLENQTFGVVSSLNCVNEFGGQDSENMDCNQQLCPGGFHYRF